MSGIRVKICGLSSAQDVAAAARAGAAYAGFVFFPKSPRNVSIEQAAALAVEAPIGLCKVALTVNASDAELDAITGAVPLDMLQLHGNESPERVAEVRARYGLPVMKAVGIADAADIPQIALYEQVADQLLIDAKKVMMVSCAANPVTEQPHNGLIWRFQAKSTQWGPAGAKIMKQRGYKNIAVLAQQLDELHTERRWHHGPPAERPHALQEGGQRHDRAQADGDHDRSTGHERLDQRVLLTRRGRLVRPDGRP